MSQEERLIIAGGGLAGCLAALAFAQLRPEVPLLLIEEQADLGGNHVWSFFDSDVAAADRWLIDTLVERRWDGHCVAFPNRVRHLPNGYNSTTSDRLDRAVRQRLPPASIRTNTRIAAMSQDRVDLVDGERLDARGVIDARGASAVPGMRLAWQKFVGRRCRLRHPHGLAYPTIMDARVDQSEGYRFVYCLPFDFRNVMIEDTYYSLSPDLDCDSLRGRIEDYATSKGWEIEAVLSEEQGVLPIVLGGSVETLWATAGAARIGLAGGFFHPTTGYSLPDAVRVALLLASQRDLGGAALHALLRGRAAVLWRQRGFYRRLNRMLFHAAAPDMRYKVFEHFYRLDAGVIGRFYAAQMNMGDKMRIFAGAPPVPIGGALRALFS